MTHCEEKSCVWNKDGRCIYDPPIHRFDNPVTPRCRKEAEKMKWRADP